MPLAERRSTGQSSSSRAEWIRAFGSDPIACSTLQEGLSYFETSFGVIAFQPALGFAATLGPPLCAPGDSSEMIRRFMASRKRPLFFYLPRSSADVVSEVGGGRFGVCGMGVDKGVRLADFPGGASARVKSAVRKAARAGLKVSELRLATLARKERAQLDEITRCYLRRSAVPVEMRFLNRPFSSREDGLSRTFALRHGADGRLFGYAVLDPYFRSGRTAGYLLNLVRFERTRIWGVYYAVVAELAAMLRNEGITELSLGYCPLVDVDTQSSSPLLARQVRWMESRFAQVNYVARLREMKAAFPGPTPQRYFATPSREAVSVLLVLIRACGVPFGWMLGPQLFRSLLGKGRS